MPRRARIVAGGYPMHVILRGIDRTAIFFDDSDYRLFLDYLSGAADVESVGVHAYVLMTNHVHLLMTAEDAAGIPQVMKRLGQRYVQHINRRYQRTGGLFEGRFRSSLIEADGYLLACQRYIELNPVRAGMVEAPADYRWSSHRANALGHADAIITPHPLYQSLAESNDAGTPLIGTCSRPSWMRVCCYACVSVPTAASCSATSALHNRSRQW